MKLCIAGSRSLSPTPTEIARWISKPENITHLVSGTAEGVDKAGEEWAKVVCKTILRFPANWEKFGKKAGFIRNKQMADVADYFLIFWDGTSPGTKMMIELALNSGKPLVVVKNGKRMV